MQKIAIFASGSGTNAENIIKYFADNENIDVVLVLSNRRDAGVLQRASRLGVDSFSFTKSEFADGSLILQKLEEYGVTFIVLAGFLPLVSPAIIHAYPSRIVNIHPALLPKFGGKGMYGHHVHEAVVAAHETETGITIHLIDEEYDKGVIVFQKSVPVLPEDTPQDVEQKVHALEYECFPQVIERLVSGD